MSKIWSLDTHGINLCTEARQTNLRCPQGHDNDSALVRGLMELKVLQKGRWFPWPRPRVTLVQCVLCMNRYVTVGA